MAKDGPISADRLKSFIERIEKLEEERKAIGDDIRDVYAEAKGVGYDVKTIRKIVQLRKMDAAERDEQEALIDVYAHALGMDIGGAGLAKREPTEEELEERASRIVEEVERCVSLVVGGALPKIEAIKTVIGCSTGKAHKLRRMVEAWISRSTAIERENPEMKTGDVEVVLWEGGLRQPRLSPSPREAEHATKRDFEPPQPDVCTTSSISCELDGGKPCPSTCAREGACVWAAEVKGETDAARQDDGLDLPSFLDRRHPAAA